MELPGGCRRAVPACGIPDALCRIHHRRRHPWHSLFVFQALHDLIAGTFVVRETGLDSKAVDREWKPAPVARSAGMPGRANAPIAVDIAFSRSAW